MIQRLRARWPEYLMEGAGLGIFMMSASVFTVLLFHPDFAPVRAVPSAFARRALMGFAMGATALGLIYSPWGHRSGAYLNPAFTLAQWRLGKIGTVDAVFYSIAQVLGGTAGIVAAALLLGERLADPSVAYVVTVPGSGGWAVAFAAELLISMILMLAVVVMTARAETERFTGLVAAILIGLFITFEAPYSGMSLNPARTLASAVVARRWDSLWVYFTAPVLGMLAAGELGRRASRGRSMRTAMTRGAMRGPASLSYKTVRGDV